MKTNLLIVSRHNPRFKALYHLARNQQGKQSLLEGAHLVSEYLLRIGLPQILVVSKSGLLQPEIQELVQKTQGAEVLELSDGLFNSLSQLKTPTGIMAVINVPDTPINDLVKGDLVLLDAIQDAGNLGSILRTSAAAGIKRVIVGPGCANPWSPRVLRAAQGAHFFLQILTSKNLIRDLEAIQQRESQKRLSIATVANGGEDLYRLDLKKHLIWIFGNEGQGVAQELRQTSDHLASIPQAVSESLNVASAAAICLFEARRQKGLN